MKKFVVFTIILIASMLMTGFAAAAGTKVDVCHYSADSGVYFIINISENAFDQHVAHGDAAPGEAIPTQPGYIFGSNCEPIQLLNVTGHWHGTSGLASNYTAYSFYMDLVQDASGNITGEMTYTNYTAHRHITGTLVGDLLTITTTDTATTYWATVSGDTTNTYFFGTGTDSSNQNVALEAFKQ